MDKFYIVKIFAGVEPEPLVGPYKTWEDMLKKARRIKAKQPDEDSLFWLRTVNGIPEMGVFTDDELGCEL